MLFAFAALLKYGKIDPKKTTGKIYIVLTILTCLSSFLVMKTGHLTGAHGLSVLVLVLLPLAIYAPNIGLGKKGKYVQTVLMSATLFFSLIPAVVETTTRLPISQPLAGSPDSPVVKMGLLVLVVLFICGATYQVLKLKKSANINPGTPELT